MGFIVLHGNRLEDLRDLVVSVLQRNPLPPTDDDVFVVQSNGIAQWLTFALARPVNECGLGISAGVSIELPARFLWRMYRQALGAPSLIDESPYAKSRMQWRILRLLPACLRDDTFAPVARYAAGDTDGRRLHGLAARLADLLDGYQVYRADWLFDWEGGRDVLRQDPSREGAVPVPVEQRWQPALWRSVQADMAASTLGGVPLSNFHRGAVHERFLERCRVGGALPGQPQRIVVFGLSSMPRQMLEALHALAQHSQVVLAVLNPCQHYWADIIEARELLVATRRRHPAKAGFPAEIAFEDLHTHANPLLAAWGRQGRDFIRMLDEFDDPSTYGQAWQDRRIDLFETPQSGKLLGAVQGAILDLSPVPDVANRLLVSRDDASLQFHVCHSPQREVEVLHDQLLAAFDASAREGRPLAARDVIVMVPDIEQYAPIVEAVFGGISHDDTRHIPYTIADRTARRTDPVVGVMEFLMTLPTSRLPLSGLFDILDVAAVRERFGIASDALPALRLWIEDSGVRWGLDADHRASLDLPPEAQNSWLFGLRRMLLGYLVGDAVSVAGIEPYDEVAGLEAEVAGGFAALVEAVGQFLPQLGTARRPSQWGALFRELINAFMVSTTDTEQVMLEKIRTGIRDWEDACADAGFDEAVCADVARESVLEGLDEMRISQRFMGGAVSFATLMPMRAIPFRLVAMLGMNDGDYPRIRQPADFDLIGLPGLNRPGDRSRRDDDRYLFLEALLSARDQLYISWCGRNARDNSSLPPSVLVGQLRDYVSNGWHCPGAPGPLASQLTTEHPLQPFSLRYFVNPDARHQTYANEWYLARVAVQADGPGEDAGLAFEMPAQLSAETLARFLQRPVEAFFTQRLGAYLGQASEGSLEDHEPFANSILTHGSLIQSVVAAALRETGMEATEAVHRQVARVRRSGALPLGPMGSREADELLLASEQVVGAYQSLAKLSSAWQGRLRPRAVGQVLLLPTQAQLRVFENGELLQLGWLAWPLIKDKKLRIDRMLGWWVKHLAAQREGAPVTTQVVSPNSTLRIEPVSMKDADIYLQRLLAAYAMAMTRPLPLPRKTAVAWVQAFAEAEAKGKDEFVCRDVAESKARGAFDGNSFAKSLGEGGDPYVRRAFPDFNALLAAGLQDHLDLIRPLVTHVHIADLEAVE